MVNILDGLFFLITGIVLVVFHKPVGAFIFRTNKKLDPRAGRMMENTTSPQAVILPGVAFIVFGIFLMAHD
ncbi:hypothetical protein [Nesterenkonia halotolerans]|uniref:Uncharacterized protein n=1 Tax=Nesterenkonia halotolerans TaxID=225325 RepID=A0ABR9J6C7_9MICC|nr:hypothetical protein [Nesterenkonia halotolerans]MBE1514407.1 hypothetical protein [Nesterenkonia halotolerans]